MLRYYIIREEDGRVLAIHKVMDSAQACFVELCAKESFRGDEIQLIVVDVNDRGIVVSETVGYLYTRGESIIMANS